jgi:hypothetical protein
MSEHPAACYCKRNGAWTTCDNCPNRGASGAAGPPSDEAPASGRDWYDEVLRLRAALASAEQRARTPEPEGEENFANKDRWEKWQECAYLMLGRGKTVRVTTSRDRKIVTVQWWGASPEGRGSATPQETGHD